MRWVLIWAVMALAVPGEANAGPAIEIISDSTVLDADQSKVLADLRQKQWVKNIRLCRMNNSDPNAIEAAIQPDESVSPLGGDLCAVYVVDAVAAAAEAADPVEPIDARETAPRMNLKSGHAAVQKARRAEMAAAPEVRILLLYTETALRARGGPRGMTYTMEQAVKDLRNAFSNSKIGAAVTYYPLALSDAIFNEGNKDACDLADAAKDNPDIRAWRKAYAGDIVVVLTGLTAGTAAGCVHKVAPLELSKLTDAEREMWRENAYAVVEVDQATVRGRWTFAHEVGHLLGAGHSPKSAGEQNRPPGYAFRNFEFKFRTLMAYDRDAGPSLKRVLEFSHGDPRGCRYAAVRGLVCGDSEEHDNAAIIRNNLEYITKYGETLP